MLDKWLLIGGGAGMILGGLFYLREHSYVSVGVGLLMIGLSVEDN